MDRTRHSQRHTGGSRYFRSPARALFLVALAVGMLVPWAGVGASDALDVVGEVVVEHGDDFTGRRAIELRYLDTAHGRFALEGARSKSLPDGARVRVRGKRHGATLVLGADSTVTTLAAGPTGTVAAAGAAVTKRVAVLLLNFGSPTPSPSPSPSATPSTSPSPSPSGSPTPTPSPSPTPVAPPQPWTAEFVHGLYFTNQKSVASYFTEVSNGLMAVTGDVFGYFTLTLPTTTCDYGVWGTAARQAATAAGVDLAAYTNVVHAFPRQSSCPWGGLGQLPGKYSWINGSMSLYVTSHELGHNFGAHHASTMRCTASGVRVPLSSSCTVDEYGDPFDVMGTSAQRHVQSWHRRQLGFLGTTDQLTVTQSGRYTVATAQVAGGTPRILRIPRPAGDFYYLEFRQPYGLYDTFTATAAAVNGVMVRVAPDVKRLQSRLLDMNPSTTTFSDAALLVGQTFNDAASGISVTTVAVGASGATVRVQLGPDTVAPSAVGALVATTSSPGDVQLTWAAATDNLEVAAYQVSRDEVVLGTTHDTKWNDTGLAQGVTYGYSVVAFDGAGNASPPKSVTHHLPDATAPSGPTSLNTVQTGPRSLTVSWDAATDNVGVTGYEVSRDGTVLVTTTATTLEDADLMDGLGYDYSVRAVDAAGNYGTAAKASMTLPDVTAPGTVASVVAQSTSATAASLTWAAATDNVGVTGYRVARDGVVVATLAGNATAHAETGLATDRTYTYSVAALDAAGNLGAAATAQVTLVALVAKDTVAPTVPGALKGTPLGSRRIGLTWTPSTDDRAGTIRYKIFRNDVLIATVTTTTYTDRPATVAWYRYKVRAVDAAGNRSAFTPSISVKAKRYA